MIGCALGVLLNNEFLGEYLARKSKEPKPPQSWFIKTVMKISFEPKKINYTDTDDTENLVASISGVAFDVTAI